MLLEGNTSKLGIIIGNFLEAYGIRWSDEKREERTNMKRCLFGTLDCRIIHLASAGNSRLQHRMSENSG